MLPRVSAFTDFTALDRLIRMAEQYPELVQEEAYDAALDSHDAIVQAMVQTPPKFTGEKRTWKSDTQRKAFFASRGFGKGIPYLRSTEGGINDAYELGFNVAQGLISVTLVNKSGYSRFVVGPLKLGEESHQQPMHIESGWQPAAPIAADQGEKLRTKTIRNIRLIPRNFV